MPVNQEPICDCMAASIQTTDEIYVSANYSSSVGTRSGKRVVNLSYMLILGRKLTQLWELLNGCGTCEAYRCPDTLRHMIDAMRSVLGFYESTIDCLQKLFNPQASGVASNDRGAETMSYSPATRKLFEEVLQQTDGASSQSRTPIFIGSLKLEEDEEIAIVAQEALRHSIIQLGSMLQDIGEEVRRFGLPSPSIMDNPVEDKEIRELIGELFRLLGKVNEPC